MAVAPDGKSVFALTYAGRGIPLKQFDLETGKVRTVSRDAHSLLAAADNVYFLQFDPLSANSRQPRRLLKIFFKQFRAPEGPGRFPLLPALDKRQRPMDCCQQPGGRNRDLRYA